MSALRGEREAVRSGRALLVSEPHPTPQSQVPSCRRGERPRPTGMEHLWSPAGATSGNQRQIARPRNGRKQAKSLALSCRPLPEPYGKEGVDGSSPSEGSQKFLLISPFWQNS